MKKLKLQWAKDQQKNVKVSPQGRWLDIKKKVCEIDENYAKQRRVEACWTCLEWL